MLLIQELPFPRPVLAIDLHGSVEQEGSKEGQLPFLRTKMEELRELHGTSIPQSACFKY